MGTIKDRSGMNLAEAENVMKCWQEYKRRTLPKKGLNLDPVTAYPADNYLMVTVICPDSAVADALSTSLFLMSCEEGRALAAEFGAEALWLLEDGSILTTEGFPAAA